MKPTSRRTASVVITALAFSIAVQPAMAWGPRTSLALVNSAIRVIGHEGRVPLAKIQKDILNGAAISTGNMLELYPGCDTAPVDAIEAEMYLLQTVRGDKIDPYFGFRLGALGKLIGHATAPMARRNATYRNIYFADVDSAIDSVSLTLPRLLPINPQEYFPPLFRDINTRDEVYEKDYQSGVGFNGTAKSSLSEDAGRSVEAITNIWYSVLTGNVLHANRNEGAIRDYIVNAMHYYLDQGKEGFVEGVYDRLLALTDVNTDLRKRLGDTFFDAQRFDLAMKEYQAALALDPGNKEIAAKVSTYYITVGDKAIAEGKLEDARSAFASALQADPLHPDAEGKRLQADKLITERDERHAIVKQALQTGRDLVQQSQNAAMDNDYVKAVACLLDAQAELSKVNDEFKPEFKLAESDLKDLSFRLRELKGKLVQGAQSLSGAGFLSGANTLADKADPDLEKRTIKLITDNAYETEMDQLRQSIAPQMEIK